VASPAVVLGTVLAVLLSPVCLGAQMPSGGGAVVDARLFGPRVANPKWAVSFGADAQAKTAPRLRLRLTAAEIGRPVRPPDGRRAQEALRRPQVRFGTECFGAFSGALAGSLLAATLVTSSTEQSIRVTGTAPVGAFLLAKFGP
jgi:hypothetical protein